jgi:tRNA(Ile)-lysidine synthase
MNLPDRFIQFIQKENLFQKDHTLLLTVSGGVDSVVLCELCHRMGFRFLIAHCNFKLRGQESERDEEFVRTLAKKYQVDLHIKEFATSEYASGNGLSIQEAARKLRYDWFYELMDDSRPTSSPSPDWIVTAHHADDNIETMLINFFRGTGIHGLRGILPKQEKIVRPLLIFRKAEIINFAIEHDLTWVEDSSNDTDDYTRNYFRHQVIPHIKKVYPEAEQNLLSNLQRFADIEMLYQQSIQRHKDKLIEKKGQEVHIPVLKLKKSSPLSTIIHEIIKDFGFTSAQVNEVAKLLDSETGKYVQSRTHRIIKNRKWLIIAPKIAHAAENIIIEESDPVISFELGELYFEPVKTSDMRINVKNNQPGKHIAQLDAAEITYPLLLRKWKTGDYFYPLGMKKKKKLSRFFIDQKLSKTDKEHCWIIEMNKKIIWVVGQRIDERFKTQPSTTHSLLITLKR